MNKKGIEISFGWMFSVIVGAIILFFALYASSRLIKIEREVKDTEIAQEIGILLTPIETNLESGRAITITLPYETRVINECNERGTFGLQRLRVATKSLGEEWQEPGAPSSFHNKYIFSDEITEGKELNVFSKPFNFPFKIADLIYIWSDDEAYCFVNTPREIEKEISELKIKNIILDNKNCTKTSKKVCFSTSGCDIDVSLDISKELRGSVKKKFEESVYFEGSALLYGAIFSNSEIYECQIKRLMNRAGELALIYEGKSQYLSAKECGSSTLQEDLIGYAKKSSINNSRDLIALSNIAYELGRANNGLSCKLF